MAHLLEPKESINVDQMQHEVAIWLQSTAGLHQYFALFLENGVEDIETVRLLTANDIAQEMGIENEEDIERLIFAVETERAQQFAAEWTVEIEDLVNGQLQCDDEEKHIRRGMVKWIRNRVEDLEIRLNRPMTIDPNRKPLRLRANTFGSELWRISSKRSDIDIAISVNFSNYRDDKQRLLDQLLRIISVRDEDEMYLIDRQYLSLIEASYPILRVKHRITGT